MNEIDELKHAIDALESQRAALGDEVVEVALSSLREKLQKLQGVERVPSERQRKQITVLFADTSGFTAMSETMDPEEVTELINGLWERLDRVILDHGGVIDKHVGDGVMALFGTPVSHEDDPERAVRAALKMQEAINEYVMNWRTRDNAEISLKMRIGINTGLTLLGTVGTTTEYTAMGDTVNLASRLESAAPVGRVLISHDTYQLVRGIFEVEVLDPIRVKGKSEPVKVYLVTGVRPRLFRVPTRGVVGVETKTIGRDKDLQQLVQIFNEVAGTENGKARVVSLVGDAGLGKSRLLYEFAKWLDIQDRRVSLFRARIGEGARTTTPYALIRSLLAFRFEIQETDNVEVAREKLLKGFANLLGETRVDGEEIAFIGTLAGIDSSDSISLRGIQDDAKQIQSRAYHYLVKYFRHIMEQQPLVLLLEDMHWVDDRSIDFVQYLISECRSLPLLIMVVCRPAFFTYYPSWGKDDDHYHRLNLHPLSDDQSHLLVREILRYTVGVPHELEGLIVSRAEGNPFYIEEVVKMLIQDGVIVPGEETWACQTDRLEISRIPASLTGVIQARLDRLPLEERVALQRAAVVGRTFWDHAVLYLNEGTKSIELTERTFPGLQEKELIFVRGASSFSRMEEFIFKNALLLDVTYESVLKQHRRIYHEQIANWLIEHADRVSEFAGRIAEHFEVAGKNAKSAYWYALAGNRAQKTYALNAAVQFYRKALKHWENAGPDPDDQKVEVIDIYQGLGAALSDLARYDEAAEAYRKMLEQARAAGDVKRQAQSLNRLTNVLGRQGDLENALKCVQEAETLAQIGNNELELAEAYYAKGAIAFYTGGGSALELVEKALDLSRKLGNQAQETRSLNLLAGVHFSAGRYEESEGFCKDALRLAKELGDRYLEMNLQNNLGQLAEARGDYITALQRYRAAVESSQELGIRDSEIHFLSNLGGIQNRIGEHKEAELNLRQAIQVANIGRSLFLGETYRHLGLALLGQKRTDEALEAAQKALKLALESGVQDQVSAAWRTLGRIAACTASSISVAELEGITAEKDAAACFQKSIEICDEYGMARERAKTLKAWAEVELECGDRTRGQSLWEQARGLFRSLGADYEVERMDRSP
jgi:class 3 adenylate cyclase/tetratricopeptide (TPR) repeat protein